MSDSSHIPEYVAYIDGGRVPGTKLTTLGGVIFKDSVEIIRYSEGGREGSNADAEWQSAIRCMTLAVHLHASSLHLRTDARVITDGLSTAYDVLRSMIQEFERNPGNQGLRKAIAARAKRRVSSVQDIKNWLTANKNALEASTSVPTKYQDEMLAVTTGLRVSVELVSSEENAVADELCRRARRQWLSGLSTRKL